MFYSHNQIIGLLTRIAEDHEQIKSFGFGELFDQAHSNLLYNADDNNLQAPTYPLMWGALVDSVLSNTDAVAALPNHNTALSSFSKKNEYVSVVDALKYPNHWLDTFVAPPNTACKLPEFATKLPVVTAVAGQLGFTNGLIYPIYPCLPKPLK